MVKGTGENVARVEMPIISGVV
jgi:hypothetical protein